MIWINGKRNCHITISDRALHYGDGCFTTARLYHGQIDLLSAHIERLREATAALKISGVIWHKLKQEILIAVDNWPQIEGVVKVILTRGSGGCGGYSTIGCIHPTRIIMLFNAPCHYVTLRVSGVILATSSIRLSINSQLAGIKHLNRLEQVLIRMELEKNGADEALVLDTNGNLVECCAANLFWRKKNQLYTPSLKASGVNGIMRRYVISQARKYGYNCHEVCESPKTLMNADEVFITNALMPILPVCCIDNRCYESRMLYNILLSDNCK